MCFIERLFICPQTGGGGSLETLYVVVAAVVVAGVFVARDEGGSWSNLTADLPNVSCVDLVCHDAQRTVAVARLRPQLRATRMSVGAEAWYRGDRRCCS